jgi:predicted MFS family arabinose efflux permease
MLRPYLQLPRTVHLLCFGTFINRAGSFLLPFLTLYLAQKRGFSESQATRTLVFCGLGSIVAGLVGGHLADAVGRRRVMLLALVGNALVLLLFSTLRSPMTILPALFAFFLLADMYRPAASAMIGDVVAPQQRALAFGLMYVAINLGFGVGASAGGFIVENAGYAALYYVDVATSLIYAAIILVAIRESLPKARTSSASAAERAGKPAESDESVPLSAALRHMLRDRVFIRFWLANLCVGSIIMQCMVTLPLYLKLVGIGESTYGRIIAINGILIAVGQLPMTAILARFNRARVIICGTLILAAGIALTAVAKTPLQFALTVVVWTIGEMMQLPFMPAVVTEMAPPAIRARYFGVFGLSFALALTVGSPIGGWLLEQFGGLYVWGTCGLIGSVGALLFATVYRRLEGPGPDAHAHSPQAGAIAQTGPDPDNQESNRSAQIETAV